MKLNDLNKKTICILGLGVENYWLVKYLLSKKIDSQIVVCDARSREELGDKYIELSKKKNVFWQLGEGYNEDLTIGDILFRAPGWPLDCPGIKIAKKSGSIVYSPMKLFMDLCPTKNIVGVTGTKGKGTTSSLIYGILQTAKKKVYLGGNIGVAPFSFLSKIKSTDWVVLELSSFQLEDMNKSPRFAVMTNFYSEHLAPADPNNPNYHKSLSLYWRAKANIFVYQQKNDWLIAGSQLETRLKKEMKAGKAKGNIVFYDKSGLKTGLPGDHNRENIAAAEQIARLIGIKEDVVVKAVAKFKGLPHRLEFVREVSGVKYYDDSFATTPEATMIAIKAFVEPKIMLFGGADKNSDFSGLAKLVKKEVKYVVLLDGQSTARIKKELLKVGYSVKQIKLVYDINSAVNETTRVSSNGDVVILSTACASFGMFKNYKERGDLFKKEINNL